MKSQIQKLKDKRNKILLFIIIETIITIMIVVLMGIFIVKEIDKLQQENRDLQQTIYEKDADIDSLKDSLHRYKLKYGE